jgi:hypothetical protein
MASDTDTRRANFAPNWKRGTADATPQLTRCPTYLTTHPTAQPSGDGFSTAERSMPQKPQVRGYFRPRGIPMPGPQECVLYTSEKRGTTTAQEVAHALAGGSPLRVGWFRYFFDDDRWKWSAQVERMHGYQPGSVTPTTALVLSHSTPMTIGISPTHSS